MFLIETICPIVKLLFQIPPVPTHYFPFNYPFYGFSSNLRFPQLPFILSLITILLQIDDDVLLSFCCMF